MVFVLKSLPLFVKPYWVLRLPYNRFCKARFSYIALEMSQVCMMETKSSNMLYTLRFHALKNLQISGSRSLQQNLFTFSVRARTYQVTPCRLHSATLFCELILQLNVFLSTISTIGIRFSEVPLFLSPVGHFDRLEFFLNSSSLFFILCNN